MARKKGRRRAGRGGRSSSGGLGLWVSFAFAQAWAQPEIAVPESRGYSLDELTKMVRDQGKTEVFADRRHQGRKLFVSKGNYQPGALLDALATATGLQVHKVDQVQFLAARDMTFEGKFAFPILPKALLDRLGKNLRPLGEKVDLAKEGLPFTAADCLAGKRLVFDELTADQQAFLAKHAPERWFEGDGNGEAKGAEEGGTVPLKNAGRLRGRKFRLGTSYQMGFVVYRPAASPNALDAREFWSMMQVYYDYRERLGVSLPDD